MPVSGSRYGANDTAPTAGGLDKGQPSHQQQTVYDVAPKTRIEARCRTASGSQAVTCQDVARVAHHFGVSYQAAVYRLRNLNFLWAAQCDRLLHQERIGRDYLGLLRTHDDLECPESQELRDRELKVQIVHLAIEALPPR